MNPYYQGKLATIYHGDCRELSLENISALVTDPPYELGFMGKAWDQKGVSFHVETWQHLRSLCLSGAPLLSFGGTRTFHRIACAIEDAGWEIRDTIMWVYGSGFPKSLDIPKAIDKALFTTKTANPDFQKVRAWVRAKVKAKGLTYRQIDAALGNENSHKASHYLDNSQPQLPSPEDWAIIKSLLNLDDTSDIDRPPRLLVETFEREIIGWREVQRGVAFTSEGPDRLPITKPISPEAESWEGYGTALKPAYEPIILGMNPLDGTFAENALKHKVAGLNIDECRIEYQSEYDKSQATPQGECTAKVGALAGGTQNTRSRTDFDRPELKGRFPANFIHDGSQLVLELFPENKSGIAIRHNIGVSGKGWKSIGYENTKEDVGYGDNGSAARFFYCAKASKAERDRGCEGLEVLPKPTLNEYSHPSEGTTAPKNGSPAHNNHPTVKPLALMKYLVKLVKMPEYNLVLDPFMGSGTTLLACIKLGIPCIGIDNDEHTCEIAARRCANEIGELVCT